MTKIFRQGLILLTSDRISYIGSESSVATSPTSLQTETMAATDEASLKRRSLWSMSNSLFGRATLSASERAGKVGIVKSTTSYLTGG